MTDPILESQDELREESRHMLATYQKLPQLLERSMSLYVVATGAGAGIQDALWKVPGCSSFLTGSEFPYAPRVSAAFAGLKPAQYVSQDRPRGGGLQAGHRPRRPLSGARGPCGHGVRGLAP